MDPRVMGSIFLPLGHDKKEIRILTVSPGVSDDVVVHGNLSVESLAESPPPTYETISYCWGDPLAQGDIYLDGILMKVPASSVAAIRRMRLEDQERRLWIDSICINQNDGDEKAQQVALMSLVYRNGMSNLIYLGNDQEKVADQTVRALTDMSKYINTVWKESTPEEIKTMENDHRPPERFQSSTSIEGLLKLGPLYSRVWFTRMWVLQEAVLASQNECHWGPFRFQLQQILRVVFLYSKVPGTQDQLYRRWPKSAYQGYMCAFWMSTFTPEHRRTRMSVSHEIHLMSRYFSSTEPRDKTFALLAILRDEARESGVSDLIFPDYRKPLLELYRDATRFILRCNRVPYILGSVSHRSEADMMESRPTSWTYLWDRVPEPYKDPVAVGHALDGYGFSKHPTRFKVSETPENSDDDPNVLVVSGFRVDTVDWIQPMLSPNDRITLRNLYPFLRLCVTDTGSIDEAVTVASQVLTLGSRQFWGGQEFANETSHRAGFRAFIEHAFEKWSLPWTDGSALAKTYCGQFGSATRNRCAFITIGGLFGLGPSIMCKGDVVALFVGGCFSSILRPYRDGYKFIGAAYVYTLNEDLCRTRGLSPELLKIR